MLLQGERGGEDLRPLHLRRLLLSSLRDLRLPSVRHHGEDLRSGEDETHQVTVDFYSELTTFESVPFSIAEIVGYK